MLAILNLLSNIITTTFTCVGIATFINKTGKFFKIIEENKIDGFKKGFDTIVLESIDDINKCVESISLIANNTNRMVFILYDITLGNKIIKKDKDGKIIICNKSKIYSGFKEKINELTSKVKKYKEELSKIKNDDKNITLDSDEEGNESYSEVSSDSDNNEDEKKDDEFFLETKE